ncbi:Transient receptor putative cation channel sub A member 1 [Nowakowskiella sp. JEL0407]|nr:Transient receptor putative cation channel sub A member 1 [Nowakowskiella sp. JEL0407]
MQTSNSPPTLLQLPHIALNRIFYFVNHPRNLRLTCKFSNNLGNDLLMRLKWVQRELERSDEKFFTEAFFIVLYGCPPDGGGMVDLRLPNVFKQILSKEDVCNCASQQMDLPSSIAFLTWFYLIEYNYIDALIRFTTMAARHAGKFMCETNLSFFDGEEESTKPDKVRLGAFFFLLMGYAILKEYSDRNNVLLRFYFFKKATKPFRKMVDLARLSPILDSAMTPDTAYFAKEIIDSLPSVLKVWFGDCTPLHVACHLGNLELVKILLSYKKVNPLARTRVDDAVACGIVVKYPDVGDSKNQTPLHYCAKNDVINCANVLLTHKPPANVNAVEQDGISPLHLALYLCGENKTYSDVLKLLLERSAKDTLQENAGGYIPLQAAIATGNLEKAKIMIDHNSATLDYYNDRQSSPITVAVINFNPAAVDFLLGLGAKDFHFGKIYNSLMVYGFDPNTTVEYTEFENDTAMHHACKVGILSVITTLLLFGANALSLMESEKTAMMIRAKAIKQFNDAKVKPKIVKPTPPPRKEIDITE